jgi:hypothetical protein
MSFCRLSSLSYIVCIHSYTIAEKLVEKLVGQAEASYDSKCAGIIHYYYNSVPFLLSTVY